MPTATAPTVEVEIPATLAGWTPVFEGLKLTAWKRQTSNLDWVKIIQCPDDELSLVVVDPGRREPLNISFPPTDELSPMQVVEIADAIARWFGGWA